MVAPSLKDSILTSPRLRITLDGKRQSYVRSCSINASVNDNVLIKFDGEVVETYIDEHGKTKVKVDESGDRILTYKMSDRALKEHNAELFVKSIEVDENGTPTINVITLLKQGETK